MEAAIKLITKIGPNIDEKLSSGKGEWKAKNESKVNEIFKQFEFLMNSPQEGKLTVSKRI